MSTALKIILDDFADFHDMRRVRRDAHGIYTLVFDQRWVLNIEFDPTTDTVCIFGSAGSVQASFDRPASAPEIEWQSIAPEQLPFGGRVGVHYATGTVILDSNADPARLDTVSFRLWVMAFIGQLELWSSRIAPRLRGEKLLEVPLPVPSQLTSSPDALTGVNT